MKIAKITALFVLLGIGANAQQSLEKRALTEASVVTEKIVKGSPFSAEAVNESIQVLADGNRIVRRTTNKLYRNSEGRFRREISGGSGGPLASFYSVTPGVTILDPVAGQRYLLDSELRTARVGSLSSAGSGGVKNTSPDNPAVAAVLAAEAAAKVKAELFAATQAPSPSSNQAKADREREVALIASGTGGFAYTTSKVSKYESRIEELGSQNIEGVEATGTRTVTTIPAGDIGNERPIEIVYERWYSNELELVVLSKHSDPRFGEQTYRLTNITRSEPDPSLFSMPSGYKLLTRPPAVRTIVSPKVSVESAVSTRPTPAVRVVSSQSTKP